MKKTLFLLSVLLFFAFTVSAKNYFIAVDGSDANTGAIDSPFATLKKAQSLVAAGDTVFIRGGVYKVTEDQIMRYKDIWGYVFDMTKSGTSKNKRICYFGYPNERPVFDLSLVKPLDKRVIVFYVSGSYLHFKNFEIVGTQVTIVGHTQSECFRNEGGNENIYEHIAMHDGMSIGFYLTKGVNNLVLNCDAYNNFDSVSDGGKGGNVDGFGGHPNSTASTGNVFRGCRAWYNSDDGFDLISANAAYTIEHCWSFYNGYRPNSFTSAGDGAGFKSGGYGMSTNPKVPNPIPRHIVRFCLAYYNKNQGFYANHHLEGIIWHNNTGYQNPSNFNMLNRKSATETVDVDGYGHTIKNNLSFSPRSSSNHIINVDQSKCSISNNSFLSTILTSSSHFVSTDPSELTRPRKEDGSLPDIDFMKLKEGCPLIDAGADVGFPFEGIAPDIGCFEYEDAASGVDPVVVVNSMKIWAEKGTLVIDSDESELVQVSSLLGNKQSIPVSVGENRIRLKRGVYIVRMKADVRKIIVR